MHRFFHECVSDRAFGAVMAVAVIMALLMGYYILKEKLQRRRKHQQWERRWRAANERAREGN